MFGNWGSTLRKNSLTLILSILLLIFGISDSVIAAEQIHASYSALKISIPISALESYAKYGVISADLAGYYQYIPTNKLQELRKILIQPLKISPAVAAQFLETQQGKFILQRLAELIQTKSDYPKFVSSSLRTALIAAAAEPGGLNVLNLLRKYPQNNINIDVASSLEIAEELEQMISETEKIISALIQISKSEAAKIYPSSFSQLPELANQHIFSAKKQTINFFDSSRNRHLSTDIYIPNTKNPAPVIVISHGLGLDSSNFRYLANHLVKNGFAVVIPNHACSEAQQSQSLIKDNIRQVIYPNEFKDRPLDIKYILDQLESDSRFYQRLNLQQVGIFGQSLGGYTALALAGAKINFLQLNQDCNSQKLRTSWNMSLLLQCRALELPKQSEQNYKDYNLQDPRIKAAMAVNPITSSIFGQVGLSQIHTPIMIVGSSEDTVAPALYEQILPFSWIIHPQKYLVMLLGGTHFSTIGNSNSDSNQMPLPSDMVGDVSQAHNYMKALSLPFFKTYIAGKTEYLPYLSAAYTQSISSQSLGLNLVQSLEYLKLAPILGDHSPETNPIRKNLSIVRLGFWILGMGISLLTFLAFS